MKEKLALPEGEYNKIWPGFRRGEGRGGVGIKERKAYCLSTRETQEAPKK